MAKKNKAVADEILNRWIKSIPRSAILKAVATVDHDKIAVRA